jgi:general secretion pathway protein D
MRRSGSGTTWQLALQRAAFSALAVAGLCALESTAAAQVRRLPPPQYVAQSPEGPPIIGPALLGPPVAMARVNKDAGRGAEELPQAGAAENIDLQAKLRERGDLVLSETTLRQALFTISESWHINLVVGEDVSGQVNGVFKNAPLHEILHSILFANGYGYRVVGQGLVVMKLDRLGDSNPLFATEAIRLRVIKPEDIIEGAELLRSPQGKVKAIPSANALMVVDLPERIAIIRKFVSEVDDGMAGKAGAGAGVMERRIVQFVPQFTKAPLIKESIDTILSKDGKSVAIESENRIVVVDYPPNLDLAAAVMRELDVPRPQVRITALIYDVSMEDLERIGINWHHALKGRSLTVQGTPESMWAVDSLTTVPAAAGTPAATMTFMNLSRNFDIAATLNLLCESKDSQLLADPSITVVDREPATIQIVTEIPYQQLTQTQQGGNIGTTAFREAGVTLKVIPHIALNETVQMEVTPTFSRLTGFTNGQNPQPIIDKREAQTTVRVLNQHWLVIGGLRQRTATKDDRAVPGLSGMKYLGALFRAHDYNFRESELVVFLRPEMVTPMYTGQLREEQILGNASSLLEQTPVAPHVLGQGEVGCPQCGKDHCHCLCNKFKNRGYLPQNYYGNREQPQIDPIVSVPSENVPAAPQITPPQANAPQVVAQQPAPPEVRRLPKVDAHKPMLPSEQMAHTMPPPTHLNPPLAPIEPSAKTQAKPKSIARYFTLPSKSAKSESTVAEDKTKSSRKVTGGKTASPGEEQKPAKVAEKPASDSSSPSWMRGWWK